MWIFKYKVIILSTLIFLSIILNQILNIYNNIIFDYILITHKKKKKTLLYKKKKTTYNSFICCNSEKFCGISQK